MRLFRLAMVYKVVARTQTYKCSAHVQHKNPLFELLMAQRADFKPTLQNITLLEIHFFDRPEKKYFIFGLRSVARVAPVLSLTRRIPIGPEKQFQVSFRAHCVCGTLR